MGLVDALASWAGTVGLKLNAGGNGLRCMEGAALLAVTGERTEYVGEAGGRVAVHRYNRAVWSAGRICTGVQLPQAPQPLPYRVIREEFRASRAEKGG